MNAYRECFKLIYNSIGGGKGIHVNRDLYGYCLELASLNKVKLQFLRSIDSRDEERRREEARYAVFLRELESVSRALKGVEHAFIKLRKPVAYVPSDIDLLLSPSSLRSAVSRLRDLGYSIIVKEPYCVTLVRKTSIVDLYVHPTIAGVIYAEGSRLLSYTETAGFNGVEVKVLERDAEAVLAVAHALYKERVYTLNDYFTVEKWLSNRSLKIAKELKALEAVSLAATLNQQVREGSIVLPYRLPMPRWITLLARKTWRDPLFTSTITKAAGYIPSKRFGRQVVSKLTRLGY
ncbi:hypothetical protein [Desulfurococcus mucosus]|nr:hypothetical protein [Desulfurococcus mucosus]